ncbi:MAG: GDP-mannose 4,6-dehydratase [Parachlamydiales bacterium]|nr:GDP-mannose 4,6-dehydratase [Parachlamydiales bacterium]
MTNFWNEKRVLVTGATGLVGSWLTKSLIEKGAYVVTLIRDLDPQSELIRSGLINKTQVVNGCLESFNSIERAINEHEIDTVFHMGAQTIVGTALRNPLPTFEANIRGTYQLLEACRMHMGLVKRVVVASSDKAYGDAKQLPYNEEMPLKGQHPYDVSKSCTDLLTNTYHHTYGLPTVIARCGNIYGGGDLNWSRLIPGTIRSYLNNTAPILRSDGQFTRDYVYVMDAVDAYMTMAEAANRKEVIGQAFNFGPSEPLSAMHIVQKLQVLMGKEDIKPVILNRAVGEIKDQFLCSAKAEKLLQWTPKYNLEDGLKQTLQWYLSFFNKTKNFADELAMV